jgi:hypothetical protein
MASAPSFASTPIADAVAISTANTNRDGTGTLGTLHTALTATQGDGSRIDLIRVVAAGTTTAGVVRVFYDDGTTVFLLKEILVEAVTPGVAQEVFEAEWIPTVPILVEPTHILKVSTHNAESFNVFAFGGRF